VDATFTPKAAPGPCIQIVSGATVPFGEIEIGRLQDAPTRTQVQSCASINIKLTASVSAAASGVAPNVVTMQPAADSFPIPSNQFRYSLFWQGPTPSDSCSAYRLALGNVPGAFQNICDPEQADLPLGPSTTRSFDHQIYLGAGSSGVGQQFSTTVTLTAMAA
jgi:hypothetical protein